MSNRDTNLILETLNSMVKKFWGAEGKKASFFRDCVSAIYERRAIPKEGDIVANLIRLYNDFMSRDLKIGIALILNPYKGDTGSSTIPFENKVKDKFTKMNKNKTKMTDVSVRTHFSVLATIATTFSAFLYEYNNAELCNCGMESGYDQTTHRRDLLEYCNDQLGITLSDNIDMEGFALVCFCTLLSALYRYNSDIPHKRTTEQISEAIQKRLRSFVEVSSNDSEPVIIEYEDDLISPNLRCATLFKNYRSMEQAHKDFLDVVVQSISIHKKDEDLSKGKADSLISCFKIPGVNTISAYGMSRTDTLLFLSSLLFMNYYSGQQQDTQSIFFDIDSVAFQNKTLLPQAAIEERVKEKISSLRDQFAAQFPSKLIVYTHISNQLKKN